MLKKKTLRKQLGVGKTRSIAIFVDHIEKSVDVVEQEKIYLPSKMNSRLTNDSNFRYGHFTNSCLEIFDKIPVLKPMESSHVQKVSHSTSLDESSIEFEFESDRSIYRDIRDIHLQIKIGLQKGRLFDDWEKKMSMEKHIWTCLSQMTIYII